MRMGMAGRGDADWEGGICVLSTAMGIIGLQGGGGAPAWDCAATCRTMATSPRCADFVGEYNHYNMVGHTALQPMLIVVALRVQLADH